jgi:hypothetical protein
MSRPRFGQAGRGLLAAPLTVLAAALLVCALTMLLLALALALVTVMLASMLLPEYRLLWRSRISRWLAEAAACFRQILREQDKNGANAEHSGDSGPASQEVSHD